jgi:hypothetical protein
VSIKSERIKQTLQEIQERREGLKCKVFCLKIDASHLSGEKKDYLARLFLEKQWFRNAVVASKDIFDFDYKTKVVQVKKAGRFEARDIAVLSRQMRQAVGNLKFLLRCNLWNRGENPVFAGVQEDVQIGGLKADTGRSGESRRKTGAEAFGVLSAYHLLRRAAGKSRDRQDNRAGLRD